MVSQDDSRRPSNPTSVLLADMLREKKAQTQRVGSRNVIDGRDIQSSPLASNSTRNGSSGQGRRSSGAHPKEMGMKEMEEHISKINKQNFDLKLEVFHLRQRNEVLEGRVDKLQALEADNEELQAINEDILLELEKRDVAVQEAVNLICELEAKIEEMADAEAYFDRRSRTPELHSTPPRDIATVLLPHKPASQDPDTPPTKGQQDSRNQKESPDGLQPQAIPSRQDTLSPPAPKSPRRVPSFILDAKKSTNVLRSLYSANASQASLARPDSTFSGDEDEDEWANQQMLNSPRLSVLSESGFSSIYNFKDNDLSPGRLEDGNARARSPKYGTTSPPNNQREARLEKWVEERKRPTTPVQASPKSSFNDHFSSIGQILEKVPSAPKSPQPQQSPRQLKPREERSPRKQSPKELQARQRRPSSPAFGGPIFGGGYLPPTPDTMSTLTVAGNSSTPSIITEKSLLDRPHTSGSGNFPSNFTTTSNFDSRDAYKSSDEERASSHQKGKNPSSESVNADHAQSSPRTGGFTEATRRLRANAPAVRPALTTTGTATIFSSEAYTPTQSSRTVSYPSPTDSSRRTSNQLSPTSSLTMTPMRRSPIARSHHSPTTGQDPTTPTVMKVQTEARPNATRSSSLRSRMASKMTKSPNQSGHQSVASRLFRRSTATSQNAQPTNAPRPPVSRAPSNHARIPRPSSLYNGAQPISSPIYKLSSLLPDEMLTDLERYSSFRNGQQ